MHREVELNQTLFGANRSLQAGSPSHFSIQPTEIFRVGTVLNPAENEHLDFKSL